jgi:hypothetical protein
MRGKPLGERVGARIYARGRILLGTLLEIRFFEKPLKTPHPLKPLKVFHRITHITNL